MDQTAPTALLQNLPRLHTTPLGAARIAHNLALPAGTDPVTWCRAQIQSPAAKLTRRGKNWYAALPAATITVNAHSYTIITAHPTAYVLKK